MWAAAANNGFVATTPRVAGCVVLFAAGGGGPFLGAVSWLRLAGPSHQYSDEARLLRMGRGRDCSTLPGHPPVVGRHFTCLLMVA